MATEVKQFFFRKHNVVIDNQMTWCVCNQVSCNVVISFLWNDSIHWKNSNFIWESIIYTTILDFTLFFIMHTNEYVLL